MEQSYWTNFWIEHGKSSKDSDAQVQVLRTLNKQPIARDQWKKTLNYISKLLDVKEGDTILDLCSGNGLIAKHLSSSCKKVIAVDISEDLLDCINESEYSSIDKILSDIREVNFPDNTFDKILIYAGIQYLNLRETIYLFEKVSKWLKGGGIFFIGDIPDRDKIWNFFNTEEREAVHFECVKEGRAIVGTWFEKEWLVRLSSQTGFFNTKILPQKPDMIYSNFRYDLITYKI